MLIRMLTPIVLIVLSMGGFYLGQAVARELGVVDAGPADPLTSDPADSNDPDAVAPEGNMSLDDARKFLDFPVYWLGAEHEGLPLSAIIRANYPTYDRPGIQAVENSVTLLYGKCVPPPGEGGCAAPFQVVIQEACQSPPGLTASDQLLDRGSRLRGAPAEVYTDGHIQLWTGAISITIFGPDSDSGQRMVNSLRALNSSTPPGPDRDLPAPKSPGELGCGPLSPARVP